MGRQRIREKIREKSKGKNKEKFKSLTTSFRNRPVETSEESEEELSDEEAFEEVETEDHDNDETSNSDPFASVENLENLVFEPAERNPISEKRVVLEIVKGKRYHCLRRYRWSFKFSENSSQKEEHMRRFGETVRRTGRIIENFLNGYLEGETASIEDLFGSLSSKILFGVSDLNDVSKNQLSWYLFRMPDGVLYTLNCLTPRSGAPNLSKQALAIMRIAMGDPGVGEALKYKFEEMIAESTGLIDYSLEVEDLLGIVIRLNRTIMKAGYPESKLGEPKALLKELNRSSIRHYFHQIAGRLENESIHY